MPETKYNGEIFFDATCRFCTGGIKRIRPWLDRRNIRPVPFENGAIESEMRLRWHDGRDFGGAEAAIFIGRLFWYTWPLATLAKAPGFNKLAHAGYSWIAKNRHCMNGACAVDLNPRTGRKISPAGWMLLIAITSLAIGTGFLLPGIAPWLWMWILAAALWISFKAMAFLSEGGIRKVNPLFFAWVGTDADVFRYDRPAPESHLIVRAAKAPFGFFLLGLCLVFLVLPVFADQPTATGWIGVTAMLCLFHFGIFAMMATGWQHAGFPVKPIMQAPWAAKTLGDFWGPRWNRAFSDWARMHVFRPLVRKFGIGRGTAAGFLASGIAHEIVISIPAGGGYGWPTAYFLFQAGGVLLQRKFRVLRNRTVTLAAVLLPAPILFHPPFIENVFTPMIQLITPNWKI